MPCNEDLILAGGYGLFELWDLDIPMRNNELWQFNLDTHEWHLPGPMTEESLYLDQQLRFEDRDCFTYKVESENGNKTNLVVFGQAYRSNSCLHIFCRISTLALPDAPASTETIFTNIRSFDVPVWAHYNVAELGVDTIPERRECFASCMLLAPTPKRRGAILLFGGYSPTIRCLDDFWLLDVPYDPKNDPIGYKWSRLFDTDSMSYAPAGRFGHSMNTVGSRVIIFAGKCGSLPNGAKTKLFTPKSSTMFLNDVWTFQRKTKGLVPAENMSDELTRNWEWDRPVCTGSIPTGRSSHKAIGVGCHLIVFGGFASRYSSQLFSLNTGTYVWTQILPYTTMLQTLEGIVPVGDSSEIFKLSQNSNAGKKKTHSHPKKKCALNNGDVPNICPRMEASVAYDGGETLYVFGGSTRYRWDWRSLKYNDFCGDLYSLRLTVARDLD